MRPAEPPVCPQILIHRFLKRNRAVCHTADLSVYRFIKKTRVVDPDPDWIRIQRLCGSGSGGKKTKKFQWKNALFSYF
jgi:hypothetical protein